MPNLQQQKSRSSSDSTKSRIENAIYDQKSTAAAAVSISLNFVQ